jgi:hypothetical protein
MSRLETIFSDSAGKCQVKFTVVDHLDNISVSMPSRKLRVEPSLKMINAIRELQLDVEIVGN